MEISLAHNIKAHHHYYPGDLVSSGIVSHLLTSFHTHCILDLDVRSWQWCILHPTLVLPLWISFRAKKAVGINPSFIIL